MSLNIHPTAIIESGAKIHTSVSVGPYSVIKKNVVIEENTSVGAYVLIDGDTHIGKNNTIFSHNSIGQAPQDKKYKNELTQLIIGESNTIREFCTINTGTEDDKKITMIGSHNWIMAYCHVAHDCTLGDHIIMANNSSLAGHVTLGDHSILGGFTLIHQFCHIGSHIISAVGTKIFKDVPDFLRISGEKAKPNGINTEGLKRRNFDSDQINLIKKAFKIIYKENNTANEALKILNHRDDEYSKILAKFLTNSNRGIVR